MKCPKCENEMKEDGTRVSSNCKYQNWQCEVCNNKISRCIGVIGYGV